MSVDSEATRFNAHRTQCPFTIEEKFAHILFFGSFSNKKKASGHACTKRKIREEENN